MKLEQKEEQLWGLTLKMNEESQKLKAQVETATTVATQKATSPSLPITIDADIISDVERKWQSREKSLKSELERIRAILQVKDEEMTELRKDNDLLASRQFEPRMEQIKRIEQDVEAKLEQYLIADEAIEV